jgi:phosphopantothenoylcysteine decarboxylase/phosphopantothenate--cysteine ligase
VTLVAANVALPAPAGVRVVTVETSAELAAAVREHAIDADAVVMAAAVADFRPASPSATKIKKVGDGAPTLELVQTEDVLASLVATRRPGQVVVGFAAETGDGAKDVLAHGADKARRKGADLLVVNPVGEGVGFGDVETAVTVLDAHGAVVARAEGSKAAVADAVWDAVHARLP